MSDFVKVAKKSEIPQGQGKTVEAAGESIALFNVGGSFHAIHNKCLHRQGPLGEGELDGTTVTCPLHGWQFDVTTGKNLMNPEVGVKKYEIKVEGEDILISG